RFERHKTVRVLAHRHVYNAPCASKQPTLLLIVDPSWNNLDPALKSVLANHGNESLEIRLGLRLAGDDQTGPAVGLRHRLRSLMLALSGGDSARKEQVVTVVLAPVCAGVEHRWVEHLRV